MTEAPIPVTTEEDIRTEWRGTPIYDLLSYHNLKRPFQLHDRAELVITMCMDFRKSLRIPDRFAYVLRTGGGNPRGVEFEISYAIAVGGARSLALVAHDDCAMVGLHRRRDIYIQGLVLEGWSRDEAIAHFDSQSQARDLSNPGSFVRDEARRLQTRYPNITVAPLFYSVEDGMLYQL